MAISIQSTSAGSNVGRMDPSKMAAHVANRMMKELDANKDSSISRDEFVAGMTKKGMSTDEAGKMFDAIDTQKTGSISRSDMETAVKNGAIKPPAGGRRPPGEGGPRPEGAHGAGGSAGAKTYDPADTNQDGTVSAQEALLYSMKQAAQDPTAQTPQSKLGNNVDEMA